VIESALVTGTPHAIGTVSTVFAEALLLYVGYGVLTRLGGPALREWLNGGAQ
jgi:hypothetical protein